MVLDRLFDPFPRSENQFVSPIIFYPSRHDYFESIRNRRKKRYSIDLESFYYSESFRKQSGGAEWKSWLNCHYSLLKLAWKLEQAEAFQKQSEDRTVQKTIL
jgi:hypothetical protein